MVTKLFVKVESWTNIPSRSFPEILWSSSSFLFITCAVVTALSMSDDSVYLGHASFFRMDSKTGAIAFAWPYPTGVKSWNL